MTVRLGRPGAARLAAPLRPDPTLTSLVSLKPGTKRGRVARFPPAGRGQSPGLCTALFTKRRPLYPRLTSRQ